MLTRPIETVDDLPNFSTTVYHERVSEDMIDGDFTFYTLQYRTTHKSPWLEPDGKLKPLKKEEWRLCSWDVFGRTAEPWDGKGNNYKPKHRKSYDETHAVWSCTSYHGWWSLKYAVNGLMRVREADTKGRFDSRDGYGKLHQAVRHEFRIVKITVSKKTEVVSCEEQLEATLKE